MKATPFFDEIDPKYKKLVEIYRMAYDRAATGKGHERHSQGESYDEQWILRGTRTFGIGGPQFQIGKKNEEIAKKLQSNPTPVDKRAMAAEFLDIINYSAAAVLALLEQTDYRFYEENSQKGGE